MRPSPESLRLPSRSAPKARLVVGLIAWLAAALAATPASADRQGPTRAAAPPESASSGSVRTLLDAGRYPDAEQAALALVHSLEPAAATAPLALADAIDLLLEARRRGNR